MNHEKYKDHTADYAVAREEMREQLRKQYKVKEGDVLKIRIKTLNAEGNKVTKIIKVKVYEIHKYFVTVRMPAGYMRSIGWWEFERIRHK